MKLRKMQFIRRHKGVAIKALIILSIIVIFLSYFYLDFVNDTINIIIVSVILANILNPIKEFLVSKKICNENRASFFIIISLIGMIFAIIFLTIPRLFTEINNCGDIILNAKNKIDTFEQSRKYKDGVIVPFIYDNVMRKLNVFIGSFSKNAFDCLMAIGNNALSYAVVPVVAYYFMCDRSLISKKVYKCIPLKKRSITKRIISDCNRLLGKYLISQLILSLIIIILTLIMLVILKIKFGMWLSIVNGLFNIIPYFGPILGAVPIIIIAFLDSTSKGIWAFVLLLIIQQIEGSIISPKLTGDSTNMHPLTIIILLVIGEEIAGFIGMIIVIPIGVIIKVIYDDINYHLF